ncbi:hypothetical protein M422DRAFT_271919 [Sphaerobolus stellatus SS14]|uniref:Uncharacterized protein n=1 Tax=Sphaerobolus stellatus (strain SS14) TaxID=990650 RepID=A0A0C9UCV5_SPHS4|nr:hypothetical protein M422DRAFT_271919 [Sphaerobolus stellatus SS14]
MPAACGTEHFRQLQTKHSQCWNCFAVYLPRSCKIWDEVEEEPRNQGARRLPDHQAQALATCNQARGDSDSESVFVAACPCIKANTTTTGRIRMTNTASNA